MNNKQRKSISNIISQLEAIRDEEQDKLDNCPEGLEESGRYVVMQEAVDNIEEAIGNLEEIL